MKNLIYLMTALTILLASCTKDEEKKEFKVNPTDVFYIKAEKQLTKSASQGLTAMTPLEVVKKANGIRYYNPYFGGPDSPCYGGFAGKDTTSAEPAFLMGVTSIIGYDGLGNMYLNEEILGAYDCVIVTYRSNNDVDTIGYIPDAIFVEAEAKIRAAYEAQDIEAVYDVFFNSFKFQPITAEEWRELKRLGLN